MTTFKARRRRILIKHIRPPTTRHSPRYKSTVFGLKNRRLIGRGKYLGWFISSNEVSGNEETRTNDWNFAVSPALLSNNNTSVFERGRFYPSRCILDKRKKFDFLTREIELSENASIEIASTFCMWIEPDGDCCRRGRRLVIITLV